MRENAPESGGVRWRSAFNSAELLREHHGAARLYVYGQDYNKRAFATAAADMLMKQVDHKMCGTLPDFGRAATFFVLPGA